MKCNFSPWPFFKFDLEPNKLPPTVAIGIGKISLIRKNCFNVIACRIVSTRLPHHCHSEPFYDIFILEGWTDQTSDRQIDTSTDKES